MTRVDLREQRECLYLMLGPNKWEPREVEGVKGVPATALRKWRLHFEISCVKSCTQKQRSGKRVHCSTIYRAMIADGWTLKKAVNSVCRRDEVLSAEHRARLWTITDDPSQFVFVDETAKDRLASRRGRAWHPRGSFTDIARAFGAHSDFRYTMLGAADINGFINEACEMVKRRSGSDDADPEMKKNM
ncbi:hypothetical protein B484DRAFT_395757 [Ochromonadaceae sp. CCMP2298]|nr:hypothetical protein B484DRAFT_395757 [Ochromonadaceae sp. CCMP2298]